RDHSLFGSWSAGAAHGRATRSWASCVARIRAEACSAGSPARAAKYPLTRAAKCGWSLSAMGRLRRPPAHGARAPVGPDAALSPSLLAGWEPRAEPKHGSAGSGSRPAAPSGPAPGSPDVADGVAFGERIIGIDHVARKTGDPGLAAERGHHRGVGAHRRLRDQATDKHWAEDAFVAEVFVKAETASRVEGGHARAGAGAAG